jgi:hypothetical protein
MLLWFVGLSALLVWEVFHDPRIDYRLVVAGALLPDVVDGVLGGPRVLHSLTFSVALLAVVMAATAGRGRRLVRRRLLAVPIGTFLHLVLDGMWARTDVFWWPFTGWSFGDAPLPSFERSPPIVVVMEVAGLVALWWFAGVRAAAASDR